MDVDMDGKFHIHGKPAIFISLHRVKLNSVFPKQPLVSPKFPHIPLDVLCAMKSECVGKIVLAISFQDFQPM